MVLLLGKIADEWSIQGVAKETRILHASPTDVAILNSIATANAEAVESELKQKTKKAEADYQRELRRDIAHIPLSHLAMFNDYDKMLRIKENKQE